MTTADSGVRLDVVRLGGTGHRGSVPQLMLRTALAARSWQSIDDGKHWVLSEQEGVVNFSRLTCRMRSSKEHVSSSSASTVTESPPRTTTIPRRQGDGVEADGLLCWQARLEVIEKTCETATSDMLLLRKLALVYTAGNKMGVLSPIRRHFVRQHHPPDAQHTQWIGNIFWELVDTYSLVQFGPKFHAAVEALSPEMGNIGNLIDHAVIYDPGKNTVEGAIQMSMHLYRTQPSDYLLKKVASLVSSVATQIRARYFHLYGDILYFQSEYVKAASMITQAHDRFLEQPIGPNPRGDLKQIPCPGRKLHSTGH
ncbi:hypothetical protein FIBSPDRAFT_952379 [Athelia psychrophila]|uniref:Uncharacterized protein n=1 Tax=Athelia psychrophila TaxID=1759441 RepID=A0A166LKI3_9AGAM|nr:hypothetical protein FIBSPDRAFT_952379 [Fibularhizoctonia sp. CBS 109695]